MNGRCQLVVTLYNVNFVGSAFLNTSSILCDPSENSSGENAGKAVEDL